MTIVTLGIDMSSQPAGTAACTITWADGRAVAATPSLACDDANLSELIAGVDAVGIDAPFGWPTEFIAAMAAWNYPEWNKDLRDRLRFRATDRYVRQVTGLWPLSVSTDRIALPAMRISALLLRAGVTDRSGDGRFFEVYPAGSLCQWDLLSRGYKEDTDAHQFSRKAILEKLRTAMPWLTVPDAFASNGDALDALVASLTVRAATQGLTMRPTGKDAALARSEGWIHLPTGFPQAGM